MSCIQRSRTAKTDPKATVKFRHGDDGITRLAGPTGVMIEACPLIQANGRYTVIEFVPETQPVLNPIAMPELKDGEMPFVNYWRQHKV